MSQKLQIAQINPFTKAEGPGSRFALWVQGCSLRCKGCFNPLMFEKSGGRQMTTSEVLAEFNRALKAFPELEGVTLLGGEPFDQAPALAQFAAKVREQNKSVITFSGYTEKHLRREVLPGATALLEVTDVLVAGPFLQSRLDTTRPWLGSSNQDFIFLTDRYSAQDFIAEDRIEITLEPSGRIFINGWAPINHLNKILEPRN